ncbi:hypothetical protein F5890DRAFT_1560627 [Lentinula detonsa]|uniref:Uncharacterized protein n=1 Tax=Lentinula detonsa TaxID=2804962 RepID=A0AA38UM18_9AGAR|nr:hypothetical protein F5890DRAFT_1560627 [Lentinula detonsa]
MFPITPIIKFRFGHFIGFFHSSSKPPFISDPFGNSVTSDSFGTSISSLLPADGTSGLRGGYPTSFI